MPSAWVIRTRITNAPDQEPYIRIGFEPKDYDRLYNAKDVLQEIADYYKMGKSIYDRELVVTPVIPQTAQGVVTIKDFVQVRGWYSVSCAPSIKKKPKEKDTDSTGVDTGFEDKLISEVEDLQSSFDTWKLEEEENMKMEFEKWKKQHQEDWKRETEAQLRKQITEELIARAERQADETVAALVRQALRDDKG